MRNVLTKHRHGREHDRGEQHIPDDHGLDEEDAEDYEVGQIGQQVHSGAPKYVHSLPYCTFSTSYVLVFTVYWIRVDSMMKSSSHSGDSSSRHKGFSCRGYFPH
ncbi:Uncharacterized protein Rs2_16964 [Raphanus sativus]|nr:Uncharacterized protein Rs2_16964 [Raphanus sativus]